MRILVFADQYCDIRDLHSAGGADQMPKVRQQHFRVVLGLPQLKSAPNR